MKKLFILGLGIITLTITSYAEDAKVIWNTSCAKCHGANGDGQTKMGQKLGTKDYTNTKVQESLKNENIVKAIKKGYKDKSGRVLMKPSENITDGEIERLIVLVRSFKK